MRSPGSNYHVQEAKGGDVTMQDVGRLVESTKLGESVVLLDPCYRVPVGRVARSQKEDQVEFSQQFTGAIQQVITCRITLYAVGS